MLRATIPSFVLRQGKTPAATLYSAMLTDERGNPGTAFIKFGDRPRPRYYLRALAQQPADLEKAASVEVKVPEIYEYTENSITPISRSFRSFEV